MAAARRRSRRSSNGSGGIGMLIVVLLVIALVVKFFWWILGAAAVGILVWVTAQILDRREKQRQAGARRCAEIAARADQQHDWAMQGDDRGIYGTTGAELMHYIENGEQTEELQRKQAELHTARPRLTQPGLGQFGPPITQPRVGPFGTRFIR